MQQNEMKLEFDSRSCNESFARVAVAAFMTQLNPTLEEAADVKTAVSEAVTNAILHAYRNSLPDTVDKIWITCRIRDDLLEVEVRDSGCGIADVRRAMEPFFTTEEENDHSGMGFAFMEAFMDTLQVESAPGGGTCVRMTRRIGRETEAPDAPLPKDDVETRGQRTDEWNRPLR
ncbi:MAG: anti-sigma F factor [Clostridiales bacterium]|nr:anti-sigma F factor [Clostridiales bacterium]